MAITLTPLDAQGSDREALIAFLTGSPWPFHVGVRRTRDKVEASIDDGAFDGEENASFWLDDDARGRVGYARLEDLTDDTPLFDLHLAPEHRGHGLGPPALEALTRHVFTTMPAVTRFEGQTRDDNIAMRRVFIAAGWVKEAHYRASLPVDDGPARASVAYAVLRSDWENGTTTPVPWDDEP